jgi:hypothetical protein
VTLRDALAWTSFPLLMGGFVAQVLFPFRAQLQPPSALPIRSAKLST